MVCVGDEALEDVGGDLATRGDLGVRAITSSELAT